MKSKTIITLLSLATIIFPSFGASIVRAAEPSFNIYVTPPITNEKILPTTQISSTYLSNDIFITASPGEYEPATFVVRALDNISSLEVVATNLNGDGGSIPSANIDIRAVKCWYQAGERIAEPYYSNQTARLLTPELLLKDDSLVKVQGGENYVKFTTGEYTWISEVASLTDLVRPLTSEFPVRDSNTLQPLDITSGTNKQFWVTVKVPDTALPGIYNGKLVLSTASGPAGEVNLQVEVLPINLSPPIITYSLYYYARIRSGELSQGTISGKEKSVAQVEAELADLVSHGVTHPQVDQNIWTDLEGMMQLRNEAGIDDSTLYYHALGVDYWGSDYSTLKSQLLNLKNRLAPYGVTELYIYAPDEEQIDSETRAQIQAAHEVGVKVFVAQGQAKAISAVDVLDLAIVAYNLDPSIAELYHNYNHKVMSYNNPQVGVEEPATYRHNFGLHLWQNDYDGAMNYNYQGAMGFIWNDFDHAVYRDHVFAYPTIDGVIDTIQWEGWREGVDDVRYLSTLLEVIKEARASGIDTSSAEAWLTNLKNSDLGNQDLDVVRSQMVEYILTLTASNTNYPTTLRPIGDKSVTVGELLEFTISASVPDDNGLYFAAANLPPGATFNTQTRTFSWTPTAAGTYNNVYFEVSDGGFIDSESITITVNQILQTGTITGKVLDASNTEPIVNVNVSDGIRSTVTDINGNYTIYEVLSGIYTITASLESYQNHSIDNISVEPGNVTTVNFTLIEEPVFASAIWVDNITFTEVGKNLKIELQVGSNDMISEASVTVSLSLDGITIFEGTDTTGLSNEALFVLKKPFPGEYLVTVTDLTHNSSYWDDGNGVIEKLYILPDSYIKSKARSNK